MQYLKIAGTYFKMMHHVPSTCVSLFRSRARREATAAALQSRELRITSNALEL